MSFLFADDGNLDYIAINCFDRPLEEFAIYASQYHNAANQLASEFAQSFSRHNIRPCPIVFMYRHTAELYLKHACLKGHQIFKLNHDVLQINGSPIDNDNFKYLFSHHDLDPLLLCVKSVTDKINFSSFSWTWTQEDLDEIKITVESESFEPEPEPSIWEAWIDYFDQIKTFEAFREIIKELDGVDSGSYTFRYPYARSSENPSGASLQRAFGINKLSFPRKMNVVLQILDNLCCEFNYHLTGFP